MQIVIDKENLIKMFAVVLYAISGGSYDNAKDTVTELLEEIGYASLPKGHGRLIDADKLKQKIEMADDDIMEEDWYKLYDNVITDIDNAKPIIEANKTESEEV